MWCTSLAGEAGYFGGFFGVFGGGGRGGRSAECRVQRNGGATKTPGHGEKRIAECGYYSAKAGAEGEEERRLRYEAHVAER